MAQHRQHKQLRGWQKATALVPLALLSGAWTASLTASGTASAAPGHHDGALPDGTRVPTRALKAPASVTVPGEIAPGVPRGAEQSVISSASTSGIPAAALAAYQRAARVIDAADPSCNLPWQLIAAIGRVESDHGRYGGNVLGEDGVSRPGIFGIPLDDSNGTAQIRDTDAGEYDNDPVYDRAVGPMQFIPSTWSVVGVDGDGDGERNPQDIDDAALATAVYLCAGDEDLSTAAGRESAVYRYNHSRDYVDLVLSIMNAYVSGDWSSVPNGSTAPVVLSAAPPPYAGSPADAGGRKSRHPHRSGATHTGASSSGSGTGSSGSSGSAGGGSGGGGTTPAPDPGTADDPVKKAADDVTTTTQDTTDQVQKTLVSTAEATRLCTDELQRQYGAAPQEAVDACVSQLQGKTLTEAKSSVDTVVAGLSGLVDDLLGGVLGGSGDGGLLN
jgi:uncharacterized membrane protein YgcG